MTTFKATTQGTNKLGLRAVLERHANDQWLPNYYYDEQRVAASTRHVDKNAAYPRSP